MSQRWPNFAVLRHKQAHKAEPVAALPEGAPASAQIPVAEGARSAPPRPDRPAVGAGEGIRVTGEDKPVGTATARKADEKPAT
jgi:hypothetical protein